MTTEPKARPRPKPRNPDRARPKTEAWLTYDPDDDELPGLIPKPRPTTPAKEWEFEQARVSALASALKWIEYVPERAAWRWTPKGPEISPRRFAIFVCEFLWAYGCPISRDIVNDCEQRLVSMWLAGRR